MQKRRKSHALAIAIALMLPLQARADEMCDVLKQVVFLNGDDATISGPPSQDAPSGEHEATVALGPNSKCSIQASENAKASVFMCIWMTSDGAYPLTGDTATRLEATIRACFPDARANPEYSNAFTTSFALPKAYISVSTPQSPVVGVSVIPLAAISSDGQVHGPPPSH
jgi:hypothetical protein